MTLKNSNALRAKLTAEILAHLTANGEDCAQIGTNVVNFPIVAEDGEEGFAEIVIRIPKETDGDDGYAKREAWRIHLAEKAEKAKANAERKAKKIAADRAKRNAKKGGEG